MDNVLSGGIETPVDRFCSVGMPGLFNPKVGNKDGWWPGKYLCEVDQVFVVVGNPETTSPSWYPPGDLTIRNIATIETSSSLPAAVIR